MNARRVLVICAAAAAVGFASGAAGVNVPAAPASDVVFYEDGSGVQYLDGEQLRVFPEDTFVWDCEQMGNRRCG